MIRARDFLDIADEIERDSFYTGEQFFYRAPGGTWRGDWVVRLLRRDGMSIEPDLATIEPSSEGLETAQWLHTESDLSFVAAWLAQATGWDLPFACQAMCARGSQGETVQFLRLVADACDGSHDT